MKPINFPYAFLISGILFFSSCVTSVNTVENSQKTMKRSFVKNKRVVTDTGLQGKLDIIRVDKAKTPSGLLKVQVTLRSNRVTWWDAIWHGSAPYKIAYRFSWYNRAGMEVKTAANTWLELDVLPGDTVNISSVAPSPACEDFILRMHEL